MKQQLDVKQSAEPGVRLCQHWVKYEQVSPYLKRAILAAEDTRFIEHKGFDWAAIEYAIARNTRQGRFAAGGSTITQQLAKNLFLSSDKTLWRKAEEAIITVMLEAVLDKRRILELYLNIIEWGDGVFGAQAAARHYFGRDASHLTPWQAARLASMVPNPRFYDRHRNTPSLARKTRLILARMPLIALPGVPVVE